MQKATKRTLATAIGVLAILVIMAFPSVEAQAPMVQGARLAIPGWVVVNGTIELTANWPVPFPDTDYTVSCTAQEDTYWGKSIAVDHVIERTPQAVRTLLADTSGSPYGLLAGNLTLHCVGVR